MLLPSTLRRNGHKYRWGTDGNGSEIITDTNSSNTLGSPVINLFISFWLGAGNKADKVFVFM